MSRRLFWDSFRRSLWLQATAVLLIVALVVVQCGREGGRARMLGDLNYGGSSASKAESQARGQVDEPLARAADALRPLLEKRARGALTAGEERRITDLRGDVTEAIDDARSMFAADRKKLAGLDADAALDRLETIERRTTTAQRTLAGAFRQPSPAADRDAAAALTELAPEPEDEILSEELPFNAAEAEPRPPVLGGGIAPAYAPSNSGAASSLPREATPEDNDETPEAAQVAAIDAKAAALENDPVRIFEYVRNNIRYEPYYGLRKGAAETLAARAGNDADQASLLVALLRAADVEARYVRGTARLPIDRVANWLGFDAAAGDDPARATDALASGGIPARNLVANGSIRAVQFEHMWVEAHVPTSAYRGVDEGVGGEGWTPLAPAIKYHEFKRPRVDLDAVVSEDFDDFSHSLLNPVDEGDAISMTPSDTPANDLTAATEQLKDRLEQDGVRSAQAPIEDTLGMRPIDHETSGYLPASLPFEASVVTDEWRAVPASMQVGIDVTVGGGTPGLTASVERTVTDIQFSGKVFDVAPRRVTLTYVPASEADAEVIDAYHGLLSTPSYAAELVPVLRVDGEVVDRGEEPVPAGWVQRFNVTYRVPGQRSLRIENPVRVGALTTLVTHAGTPSPEQMDDQVERVRAPFAASTPETAITDARLGAALDLLGRNYFARNDGMNGLLARIAGVHQQRQISGALLATSLDVRYLAGFPIRMDLAGLNIDVDADSQSVTRRNTDADGVRSYVSASGAISSQSEGEVLEAAFGVPAASSTRVLQVAAAEGIPTYFVTSENEARVLPLLEHSDSVKREISEAIAAGNTVTIPKRTVSIGGWTGSGYVVADPTNGAAAYRLSGGLNGGAAIFTPAVIGPQGIDHVNDAIQKLIEKVKQRLIATAKAVVQITVDNTERLLACWGLVVATEDMWHYLAPLMMMAIMAYVTAKTKVPVPAPGGAAVRPPVPPHVILYAAVASALPILVKIIEDKCFDETLPEIPDP